MTRLRRRAGTHDYLIAQKDLVILEPEVYKGRWHDFFGNDHPIYVELGMGKGEFVTQMSAMYPDNNFIGIDLYDELVRTASEKAMALGVEGGTTEEALPNEPMSHVRDENGLGEHIVSPPSNLALALHNIAELEKVFAPGEVERFFLNFSDPWPKKRHARRRLTHPSFVNQYIPILNGRGQIHLRTDSLSLFEFSLNTFVNMNLKLRNISLDLHREGTPDNHIFTEYESKFIQKGMNIYSCEVIIGEAMLASLDKL